MSLFTFLMSVCLAPLSSCVDNYVVRLHVGVVPLLPFLCSVCPVSLLSCGDNYVDFYSLCHCLRF